MSGTVDGLDDHAFLRRAFAVATAARQAGYRPFGALVVEAGDVIADAGSTQHPQGDTTAHAEMNAVRLAVARAPRERLARATLYASSEPCAMCTAAAFYCGIGRIVFGFPEARLRALRNGTPAGAGIGLSCRAVLARATRPLDVDGPLLEDEAAAVHADYWPPAAAKAAAPASDPSPAERDAALLRRAIALADEASGGGELPFGAVIASGGGDVIVEAISTEIGDRDWTCHAETNAIRQAAGRVPRHVMAEATLYASSECCAMCASAIFYGGIRRIVYGFGEPRLRQLLGTRDETAGLGFSCREILAHAAEPVEIVGPFLESEAAVPHMRYWTQAGSSA